MVARTASRSCLAVDARGVDNEDFRGSALTVACALTAFGRRREVALVSALRLLQLSLGQFIHSTYLSPDVEIVPACLGSLLSV
jgi:hypothetical protein